MINAGGIIGESGRSLLIIGKKVDKEITMFNFLKKKKNISENKIAFCNFVRGVWQSLAEMNELDYSDWTQMQNVSNLCVLAWNCTLMDCPQGKAKQTISEKLQKFFQCDDENIVAFVRQTMDFKYQNYAEFHCPVLKSNVSLNAAEPQIEVILDQE